jgi:hypothetical protein
VERLGACDLVLDAILGIGGSAGLRDDAWRHVQDLGAPVVSVDVPSGIDVDGGTLPGDGRHVRAAATVTFGTAKIGLLAGPAADCAGALRVIDIGLGPHLPEPSVRTVGVDDLQRLVRVPGPADHKYTRGVVGVAAGSPAYTGAGLLSVAGASCGLAGMVRYVGPDEVAGLVRAAHPEVVVGEGRVQAWVVGSGGGDGAEQALRRAYDDGVAVVVDADALRTWTALHRCRRCSHPTPVSWRPCWAPSGPRSKQTPSPTCVGRRRRTAAPCCSRAPARWCADPKAWSL